VKSFIFQACSGAMRVERIVEIFFIRRFRLGKFNGVIL
jgi:hypothetical protein